MAFQRINQLGLDLSITRCFSYKHIFRYYLYLHQWFKLKKTIISLKYLHDDIYHRAYDSVYLKKFKFQSSIYLTYIEITSKMYMFIAASRFLVG